MGINKQITQLIQERIAKLKTHNGKKYLNQDILYPDKQKRKDIVNIQEEIDKLKFIHCQIRCKIKKIKNLIPDITDQSTLCAVYLIYGKILQTWEAIFFLASKGYDFNTMELTRSISENLGLIKTFHLDKKQKHLKQWFQGKIIVGRVSRKLEDKFIKDSVVKPIIEENDLSSYDMATDIYGVFSNYTHCSYIALLDSVDVFNEDFDWNLYAGSHYTLHNIHVLKSFMAATLITLKMTYGEIGDVNSYEEVNKMLISFAGPMDKQSLKNLIPKIKK